MRCLFDNRVIAHVDANSYYASMEMMDDPSLTGKALAVCGRVEERHGIVLAASPEAKWFGVKTGQANWEALRCCPRLTIVPPDYPKYIYGCKDMRRIFLDYTPLVEGFGLDEAFLDITGSLHRFGGDPVALVQEILERIHFEMGITCSAGISFNKVFAKFGSDLAGRKEIIRIGVDNYQEIMWPRPVKELLNVGSATNKKLGWCGISTVGQLAKADPEYLRRRLGKNGVTLWQFANGYDKSQVKPIDFRFPVKSISNSSTMPRDLINEEDIAIAIDVHAESVAARLRMEHLKCRGVQVGLRFHDLMGFERQTRMGFPCYTARSIGAAAKRLVLENWRGKPLRGICVRAIDLVPDELEQMCLLPSYRLEMRQEKLEKAWDVLEHRFGHGVLAPCSHLTDPLLSSINPKDEHVIYPMSYM